MDNIDSKIVTASCVDEDGFRKSSWSVHNPASRFCVAVKMVYEATLLCTPWVMSSGPTIA